MKQRVQTSQCGVKMIMLKVQSFENQMQFGFGLVMALHYLTR